MKKVIAILMVLALVAGIAFAASGDMLKLKSTVGEVLPNYQIRTSDYNSVTKIGAASAVEVDTNLDIATGNISWDFIIKQVGNVESTGEQAIKEFAKTYRIATLTITLDNFKSATVTAKNNPIFTAMGAVAPAGDNEDVDDDLQTDVVVPSGADLSNNSAEVTLTYHGVNWADQDVVTFTALWTQDDTLPMGDYYANITLEYEVN